MSKRTDKYIPETGVMVEERRDGDDRVTVYRWKDNPASLWAWNLGPAAPTRVDLRGLEHLPSTEQLEPALALLMDWREQRRRDAREIAGPGRQRGISPETAEDYQFFDLCN